MKAILLALIVVFAAAGSVLAQLPRETDGDPDSKPCRESSGINLTLRTTGAYLPGATIGIGSQSTIWAEVNDHKNHNRCKSEVEDLPRGKWKWQLLERPAQSTSQLAGTNQEAVTLLLDQLGDYKIQFTACPSGCQIPVLDGATLTVAAESREIVIRVLAILPPDQSPALPPSASPAPTPAVFSRYFPRDADYLSAAWRTVQVWNGPSDYKTLEGLVVSSTVSSVDNNFNHYGMDWQVEVRPDTAYRGLLGAGKSEVEVEWERGALPEKFRPTEGDRVSAIGYWVYDCGHGAKTEIHPPVLLATHRPRAIALPAGAGAGSNVYVPGIVTDIFVSREGGQVTDCAGTSLDQQKAASKPLIDGSGRLIVRCLPFSEGFSSNPINRIFEFNIHLPHSPQAIMAAVGKTAPPVPLYLEGCSLNGPLGLEPSCVLATAGGVQFLKVRIDLRAYKQESYSRRIVAGWAHAAPDNWGARRWNVLVTSLDVTDDSDSLLKGDGDWRFWVNTNNGGSEWAKLLDGGGNAHGVNNFDGTPWATNAVGSNRNLGPSIVLFPNQFIWLATRGFENDWYFEDSVASLSLRLRQARESNGIATANDGSGKYVLHYQVQPGIALGRAQLSPAALARYKAYFVTNTLPGATIAGRTLLDGVFNSGASRRDPPRLSGERENVAPLGVARMKVPQIRQLTQLAMSENPAKLNTFFRDLKRVLQRAKTAEEKADAHEFLTRLKSAISPQLWQKHGLEADMSVLVKTQ